MKRKLRFFAAILSTLFLAGCGAGAPQSALPSPQAEDKLRVVVMDTGDSDAILVTTPAGQSLVIDTGLESTYPVLRDTLRANGVKKVDVLLITHPHKDHVGGADHLLEDFAVESIYAIDVPHESTDVEEFAAMMEARGLAAKEARAGVRLPLDGVEASLIAPLRTDYEELNDCSAVLRLAYGEKVFLFMGDAEKDAEADLLEEYGAAALKADVLKTGHHGAKDASGKKFVAAVRPEVAIMTGDAAADPDHVHQKAIERLENVGARVLRTDRDGAVTLTCDGSSIGVETEK